MSGPKPGKFKSFRPASRGTKKPGFNASEAHVNLVSLIVAGLPAELQRWNVEVFAADGGAKHLRELGLVDRVQKCVGLARPDVWLVRKPDTLFAIEVGGVDPDKWLSFGSMFHVTFGGNVGVFGVTGTDFELATATALTEIAAFNRELDREADEDAQEEEGEDWIIEGLRS